MSGFPVLCQRSEVKVLRSLDAVPCKHSRGEVGCMFSRISRVVNLALCGVLFADVGPKVKIQIRLEDGTRVVRRE